MRKIYYINALFLSVLSGCGYSIANIDKPIPDMYTLWSQPGKTELDVKKSLLECGKLNPAGYGLDISLNEAIRKDRCMENIGYQKKTASGRSKKACDRYEYLPACQTGAEVALPKVSTRLNSNYCQTETNYDYCKKNAANKDACDSINYDNPVPECLP